MITNITLTEAVLARRSYTARLLGEIAHIEVTLTPGGVVDDLFIEFGGKRWVTDGYAGQYGFAKDDVELHWTLIDAVVAGLGLTTYAQACYDARPTFV